MPASASGTVAEALARFRAGETVEAAPAPAVAEPAAPVTTGRTKHVVFPRPNGESYYARAIPGAAHDVDMIRQARGATLLDNIYVLAYGRPGTGKGHPLATPILTPNGWTTIGELSVGDTVTGSDGKHTTVYGVFDRGVLPTYRVTMSDGSSVEVDSTHLWRVQNKKHHWITLSTQDIIDRWDDSYGKFSLNIPTIGEYDPAPASLPIPPYMLGALIADGSLNQSTTVWTKNDQNIADEMARQIDGSGFSLIEGSPSDARRWRFAHIDDRNSYSVINGKLAALGLRGLKSGEKFIPDIYKTASLAQRRALLAGLMDGDGSTTFGAKGQAVYNTTSRRLAEDVRELMWSLGDSASLGDGKFKNGTLRVGLLTHRNPFLASKYAESFRPSKTIWARRIIDIARVEDQEIRCIAVTADDHLYVTKDYIVTHNTSAFEAAFPDLITVTCNRDTDMDALFGTWVQNPDGTYEWIYGPVAVAAQEGRPVLLDEIAVAPPQVITDLYESMDGRGTMRIKNNPKLPVISIKDGFWIGGAFNPHAPGADVSDALLSRFGIHIEATTDYALAADIGVPAKFIKIAKNLQEKQASNKVTFVHQMRELLIAKKNTERFGLDFAARNFVGVAPEDDRPVVADVASRIFGFAVTPLSHGDAVKTAI